MPRKQRIIDEDDIGIITPSREMALKTIEGNENRIVNKAIKAIEKRIDSGKATASELLFFAKLGTKNDKLDKEIKENQKMLLEAKTSSIKQGQENQKLIAEAIQAFRTYSGQQAEPFNDEYEKE